MAQPQPKPIRIAMAYDDWAVISAAVIESAQQSREPWLFDLAAQIEEVLGLSTIAACHRDEGQKLLKELDSVVG